jgi:hypothetical protein
MRLEGVGEAVLARTLIAPDSSNRLLPLICRVIMLDDCRSSLSIGFLSQTLQFLYNNGLLATQVNCYF